MSQADVTKNESKKTTCRSCTSKTCPAQTQRHDESDEEFADRQKLQSRLCRIKHKIVVLSGKGGVGKSTVSVNLATALSMAGYRVGLLDIDIHGPSIPTMLGIASRSVEADHEGLLPIEVNGLKVMSIGFLLENQDEAVIWRGPRKMGVIRQFLRDVSWGDLDYLIVDSPPGTGDEPLSICQILDTLDGAVIVTTPQKVASVDVRKSVTFCNTLNVPVLGVVENMSGFVCPACGTVTHILPSGGGRALAESMHVPFLGAIPMDPAVALSGDTGQAFVAGHAESPTTSAMQDIVRPLIEAGGRKAAS
ncbi:Mrp/NBP35 family ATP-binding protein [Desulfatiferula olefinivorans]